MKLRSVWIILLTITAMAITSCSEEKFHICGAITEADKQTLYLENVGLNGVEVIDSVRLKDNGKFIFSLSRNDAPEFYRLRLDRQIINIAVDSTETITISAAAPTMAYDYNVEGSDDCAKIKELSLMQMSLQAKINEIIKSPALKLKEVEDSINTVINDYKEDVKINYIFAQPNKSFAYFALFQTIVVGNAYTLIFNPRNNNEDLKVFAAVGTSWDTYYPNSIRSENLHNITIEGMKNMRIVQARESQVLDADRIDLSGVVNISLYDNKGTLRNLSDLKGKVVMLDFCAFAQEGTNQRIMALREVYNKYHEQGFEIFQVSIDTDEHFWKTQTAALPWVSVNDPRGLESTYLMLYNIAKLPTFFLLQRDCTPILRDEQIEDLDKEIQTLL